MEESNDFDGAFKKKAAPPRAPRRRKPLDEEEPADSVRLAAAGIPVARTLILMRAMRRATPIPARRRSPDGARETAR